MELPPIETCARPGCGELFLKTRSDRRYCKNACAAKAWYDEVSAGKRVVEKQRVSEDAAAAE